MIDQTGRCLAGSLSDALKPHRAEMARFAEVGKPRLSRTLNELWASVFPMVWPPDRDDGLGIILLDSNADTHFSFTNALGMISMEQVRGIEIAAAQYPRARWIIALHHHVHPRVLSHNRKLDGRDAFGNRHSWITYVRF